MKNLAPLARLLLAESVAAPYLQASARAALPQISPRSGLAARSSGVSSAGISVAHFASFPDATSDSGNTGHTRNSVPGSTIDAARGSARDSTQSSTPGPASNPPAKHQITITFDYDFQRLPACSEKATKKCVSEFDVYDVSAGADKAFKLLSIPAPADAAGLVKGIHGTTPPRGFG